MKCRIFDNNNYIRNGINVEARFAVFGTEQTFCNSLQLVLQLQFVQFGEVFFTLYRVCEEQLMFKTVIIVEHSMLIVTEHLSRRDVSQEWLASYFVMRTHRHC